MFVKKSLEHIIHGLTMLRNVQFNNMHVNTLGALWKKDAISLYFIMKNLYIYRDAPIVKLF